MHVHVVLHSQILVDRLEEMSMPISEYNANFICILTEYTSDLTVWVRVGAAHYFPFVLKYLHPVICLPKVCNLIGPFIYDPAHISHLHYR